MLRAVDLQQIFSQTSSLEKVQNVRQQRPDVDYRHFMQQLNQEDDRMRREVTESHETGETEIKDEDRGKEGRRGGERRKGASKEDSTPVTLEKPPEIDQGKIVDIII